MEAAVECGCRIQMADEAPIEDTDADLMLRFKAGDVEAFDRLFARHTRALINFAYRFVRNRGAAEELAQEIFLRVYEAAAGYEVQAKFTSWLYRIATNVCLNEIRKPHVRAVLSKEEENCNVAAVDFPKLNRASLPPDRLLEQQAVSRALSRTLEQLPEKQRAAFILNKYEELSYGEVADAMKISEKAVKSLIHRAKETLAEKLRPLLPELMNL